MWQERKEGHHRSRSHCWGEGTWSRRAWLLVWAPGAQSQRNCRAAWPESNLAPERTEPGRRLHPSWREEQRPGARSQKEGKLASVHISMTPHFCLSLFSSCPTCQCYGFLPIQRRCHSDDTLWEMLLPKGFLGMNSLISE